RQRETLAKDVGHVNVVQTRSKHLPQPHARVFGRVHHLPCANDSALIHNDLDSAELRLDRTRRVEQGYPVAPIYRRYNVIIPRMESSLALPEKQNVYQ